MHTVDDIIAIAEHQWQSMGIAHQDRATLSADLRLELDGAAADGVSWQQLLGDDIRAFARNVANEAGVTLVPPQLRRLLLTALAGATPGVLLGWVLLWWLPTYGIGSLAAIRYGYPLAPVVILVGALATVRIRMADAPAIGRTVRAMALLVPLAGLLITPVTIGFAATTDYSTAMPVVLLEVALVAGALSGAVVLARRWALAPVLRAPRLAPTR